MYKILVVDDEKSIRITFSKFLGNEGYEVFTAEDVEKALKEIDRIMPDLVVTDIIMPQYSGMDLLKKIKEKAPDIPVIIMTGEPSVDTATESVHFQAYDYLQKPVDKSKLVHTVTMALEHKKIIDEKKKLERENNEYRDNLEKLVEKRTEALRKAIEATISAISSMLELRDPYTAGHDRRVGNLAYDIAEKLGLEEESKTGLLIAGYLHDIGKISIPTEILSKPGKITSLEYEIIKTHVQCGYDILKKVDLKWPIAELVYNHHERMDGSGYPQGKEAAEISFDSRVLMVADVVEAMLSHRPYRPANDIGAVLSELKKNAGKSYDQKIVAVVEEMFTKDNYRLMDDEIQIDFAI
ncbi:MAG: response regulator [Clostridia bacterium]|nr:response regulator [Clostridia bacterium]